MSSRCISLPQQSATYSEPGPLLATSLRFSVWKRGFDAVIKGVV
jgi:hypothetical protein